jgi:hypothetical protein
MSYVEIYAINKDGKVGSYAEERNAVAGAWLMWDTLNKKYNLPNKNLEFKELWDLTGTDKMSRQDKIACVSTFDRVWIKKEYLNEVADAWDSVWDYILKNDSARVDTIKRVANTLRRAAQEPDIMGVCFNHTSVCGDPWVAYEEGDEETVSFQFGKHEELAGGGKPWELFEWLNSPD